MKNYYTISNKGLEDKDKIIVQINLETENNEKKFLKYLEELNEVISDNLFEQFENINREYQTTLTFEISKDGFIDKKSKLDGISDKYNLGKISYLHDISKLNENQLVNLTYLRNISLNSGYNVFSYFQFESNEKDELIKCIKKAVRKICRKLYEDSEIIINEILDEFNSEEIIKEEGKYVATIFYDTNESLKEYLSSMEFNEELIEDLEEIAEDYTSEFNYQTVCSNRVSEENIYIY